MKVWISIDVSEDSWPSMFSGDRPYRNTYGDFEAAPGGKFLGELQDELLSFLGITIRPGECREFELTLKPIETPDGPR